MSEPRIALVTGGARGIGAEVVRLLGAAGMTVCVNCRQNLDQARDALEAAGGNGWVVAADVGDEAQVKDLFRQIDAREGRLAALVNNAGVLFRQSILAEMSVERMRRVIDTNLLGTLLCSREAVRRMSQRYGGAGGAIVNVSSAAARLGSANEYVDYAATKGAVDTLTLGLAGEEGPYGIRVNAVRPGIIETTMHADGGEPGRVARLASQVPLRRGGSALEAARAIVWLLSDEASYVNGALLDVSGGR